MKVYIASFFANKDVVKAYGEELKTLGIEPTMRWPLETGPHNMAVKDVTDEYHRETAVADLADIIAADTMVMLIPNDTQMADQPIRSMARGGRHFETGFFYGLMTLGVLQKTLVLVGPRENVFHFLDGQSVTKIWPAIQHFDTWEQAKTYLEGKNRG